MVMSVYNGERYLRESMDSVLAQTRGDFDFTVVDDGSNDATADMLAEYESRDPRISILTNRRNLGLAPSLNRAIASSRGEFIARQDADDRSDEKRFAAQLGFFARNPGVGLLGTAYHEMDANGCLGATHRPPTDDTSIRWQMLFHNAFCHSSVMFRRPLFDRAGGYDARLMFAQDYDLWARMLRHGRGRNLPEPLVAYRAHDTSAGRIGRDQQTSIVLDIANRQLSDLAPNVRLTRVNVATLRRWFGRFPALIDPNDVPLCRRLLRVLAAFEECGKVDAGVADRIRREWQEKIDDALTQTDSRHRQAAAPSAKASHSGR